jgi:hypothetical protein
MMGRVNQIRRAHEQSYFEKEPDTNMKKITSAVIGLSLTLAAAGFAAQAPAASTTPSTTPAAKHVKKHKKAAKADTSATTPAPATTK